MHTQQTTAAGIDARAAVSADVHVPYRIVTIPARAEHDGFTRFA